MNAQTVLQEQARAAYKRKDYTKALELFNRAIGRTPSVQLHDNRAACHERLDDLQAALKDAKKSIQLAKEDPTGYVRAGRILEKMERKSVALEIYDMGLKNVKHVGQGFEVSWLDIHHAWYPSNISISSSKRSTSSS
jgi:F-box/TPR repeat protein Pof3